MKLVQWTWGGPWGHQKNSSYKPLQMAGSIRLIRVMPSPDETAQLHCELFEYPLLASGGVAAHLFEALSYVWGPKDEGHSISINNRVEPVTNNLHAALLSLRDVYLERILWVDAICINQGDEVEKAEQIQYMPDIYSKATRVIVWLGEAADGSDWALQEIRMAAEDPSIESLVAKPALQQAVLALLRRPWFERIWVGNGHHAVLRIYLGYC